MPENTRQLPLAAQAASRERRNCSTHAQVLADVISGRFGRMCRISQMRHDADNRIRHLGQSACRNEGGAISQDAGPDRGSQIRWKPKIWAAPLSLSHWAKLRQHLAKLGKLSAIDLGQHSSPAAVVRGARRLRLWRLPGTCGERLLRTCRVNYSSCPNRRLHWNVAVGFQML